jgi:flagellar protein FlgJ
MDSNLIRAGLAVGVLFLIKAIMGNTSDPKKADPTAGPEDFRRAFVRTIWEAADRIAKEFEWPRDLIITVAAHESNWGRSQLSAQYHNLFGFKASKSWLGERIELPTWEVLNGKTVKVTAPFRVYDSWDASIRDYVRLVTTSSRYGIAAAAAKAGDLPKYFTEIQRGGYATDPKYPAKLAAVYQSVEERIV